MKNNSIDTRIFPILRWSIAVQIVFFLLSAFSTRSLPRVDTIRLAVDVSSLISALLLALVLFILFIPAITSKIRKPHLLFILYLLAAITILIKLTPTPIDSVIGLREEINLLRWQNTFYLFIPLVFIAWQYSLQEVIWYCVFITLLDIFPLRMIGTRHGIFQAVFFMGNILRAITMGIIGWIANSLAELQRSQQNELVIANRKLRNHALTAERLAQSQERNRIARELHDTLAHTLSSVAVQLEAVKTIFSSKPNQAKQMLEKTLENTRQGLDETRRVLVDMRSSAIETYGLKQAIGNLVSSAAERGGFQIQFDMPEDKDLVSEEINHCIYRSVQEALENCIKHSKAQQVIVKVRETNGIIETVIEDDGVGFDTQKIKNEHMGIRGMRERVELLEGKLRVESEPQKGTKILILLPIEHD